MPMSLKIQLLVKLCNILIMNIEIKICSPRNRFEECVREESAHLATLKSKKLIAFLKTLKRLKQEWQKNPALGPGKQTAKTGFGLEK
jgi:hypothetical protein